MTAFAVLVIDLTSNKSVAITVESSEFRTAALLAAGQPEDKWLNGTFQPKKAGEA